MNELPVSALLFACYCLSAVVVLIGLHLLHYNRHCTWIEAFQLYHGERAWMVVALFALVPFSNTILALEFMFFWKIFDRIDDE